MSAVSNPPVPRRDRRRPTRFVEELSGEIIGGASRKSNRRAGSARKGRNNKAKNHSKTQADDSEEDYDYQGEGEGDAIARYDQPQMRTPPEASWPEATPTASGEAFFSVASDGVGWQWAQYQSSQNDFYPPVHWRTQRLPASALPKNSQSAKDPFQFLGQFLPPSVQSFFFGDADPPNKPKEIPSVVTRHRAFRTAALRPVPIVNVYVLFDSECDLSALAFLLSQMPVRLYRIRPKDVILPPLSCSRSVEQSAASLAAARGALADTNHKLPALVVIANPDSISLLAVTSQNQVVEAGITLGILSKIEPLTQVLDTDNGRLSAQNHTELTKLIKEVKENKSPPFRIKGPLNARDQVIGSALYETAAYLDSAILQWQAEAIKEMTSSSPGSDKNDLSLKVLVGGLDAWIIAELLQPNHGGLLQDTVLGHPSDGICAAEHKNLLAKGVQQLLIARYKTSEAVRLASDEESARQSVVGCRIAKQFGSLYRGSVASVVSAENNNFDNDIYRVVYDDGDEEDYYPMELYGHLLRYSSAGEEWARECPDEKAHLLDDKVRQANQAAQLLARLSPKLCQDENAVTLGGGDPRLIENSSSHTDDGDQTPVAASLKDHPEEGAGGLPDAVVFEVPGAPSAASSLVSVEDGAAAGAAANAAVLAAAAASSVCTPASSIISSPSGQKRKKQQSGSSSPNSSRGRGRPRYTREADLENPAVVVGRGVAKYFSDPETNLPRLYYGQVKAYKVLNEREREEARIVGHVIWDIAYDDGDEEGMDLEDILEALKLYQKARRGDSLASKRKAI